MRQGFPEEEEEEEAPGLQAGPSPPGEDDFAIAATDGTQGETTLLGKGVIECTAKRTRT